MRRKYKRPYRRGGVSLAGVKAAIKKYGPAALGLAATAGLAYTGHRAYRNSAPTTFVPLSSYERRSFHDIYRDTGGGFVDTAKQAFGKAKKRVGEFYQNHRKKIIAGATLAALAAGAYGVHRSGLLQPAQDAYAQNPGVDLLAQADQLAFGIPPPAAAIAPARPQRSSADIDALIARRRQANAEYKTRIASADRTIASSRAVLAEARAELKRRNELNAVETLNPNLPLQYFGNYSPYGSALRKSRAKRGKGAKLNKLKEYGTKYPKYALPLGALAAYGPTALRELELYNQRSLGYGRGIRDVYEKAKKFGKKALPYVGTAAAAAAAAYGLYKRGKKIAPHDTRLDRAPSFVPDYDLYGQYERKRPESKASFVPHSYRGSGPIFDKVKKVAKYAIPAALALGYGPSVYREISDYAKKRRGGRRGGAVSGRSILLK
jgi:hypothetical protein